MAADDDEEVIADLTELQVPTLTVQKEPRCGRVRAGAGEPRPDTRGSLFAESLAVKGEAGSCAGQNCLHESRHLHALCWPPEQCSRAPSAAARSRVHRGRLAAGRFRGDLRYTFGVEQRRSCSRGQCQRPAACVSGIVPAREPAWSASGQDGGQSHNGLAV